MRAAIVSVRDDDCARLRVLAARAMAAAIFFDELQRDSGDRRSAAAEKRAERAGLLGGRDDAAEEMESVFARNGW